MVVENFLFGKTELISAFLVFGGLFFAVAAYFFKYVIDDQLDKVNLRYENVLFYNLKRNVLPLLKMLQESIEGSTLTPELNDTLMTGFPEEKRLVKIFDTLKNSSYFTMFFSFMGGFLLVIGIIFFYWNSNLWFLIYFVLTIWALSIFFIFFCIYIISFLFWKDASRPLGGGDDEQTEN